MTTIGLLNPGEMGSVVGAAVRSGGSRVLWAGEGRSAATRKRASEARLEDAGSVSALVAASDVILSVCPPAAAVDVASQVAKLRIAAILTAGPLQAIVVPGGPGAASTVKMAYASWTKGSAALLLAVCALASAEGVEDALVREWKISQPDLSARAEGAARSNAKKAWRFVGEMEEIAATFAAAGLPDAFHQGAAEIYRRMEVYKEGPAPSFADVLRALTPRRPA